jgi:hypothetical protein
MKQPIIRIFQMGLLSGLMQALPATTIEVISTDPAGYGFNDTTVVSPEGGNDGVTLGEQRVNVLQRAGEIWAAYLHSTVPIKVEAKFDDLGGSPDGYALAGASAITVVRNFANAPVADFWYPVALGNSLAGSDLSTSNDIRVTVNIAPDDDPALPSWYYGLDGNAPANRTDLLDVLLHEIGHGLGFASFADIQAGSFLQRTPDIYSLNLYDVEFASGWGDLSKRNLQLSAKNDPDLTWSGPYSTAAAPYILERKLEISVTAPASLAGTYAFEGALFGPPVTEGGIVEASLVIVDDGVDPATDACDPPFLNAAAIAGNIAYIDRGSCNFDSKVLAAQQAGAIAVIIANNVTGGPAFMSGNDEVDGVTLTIPAVSISLEDGALLTSEPGVVMDFGVPSTTLAGTNGGFVRIYAPDPIEQGSSVSHWTIDASPDLLMEPFINSVFREDLDLSLTLMKDIGWVVVDIPYPHLTYDLWVLEAFSPGATLLAVGDDPDGDGVRNIEEYFFGGDPESSSADTLPKLIRAGAGLDFTYIRTTAFTDLVIGYEISTDMTTWSPAVEGVDYTEEVVSPVGTTAEQVQLKMANPSSGEEVFVRLRIDLE